MRVIPRIVVVVMLAMVTMMMVMVMGVVMIMVMPMVFATIRRGCQLAGQVRTHEFLYGPVWTTRPDGDTVQIKVRQCPVANAAGDYDPHPQLPQPSGERTRLMLRCGKHFGAQDYFLFRVNFDHGELAATAEVPM